MNSLGPLIADLDGIELSQLDKEVLIHPKLGGLILFSRNFESQEQLSALIRCIREERENLVLCVDHEGGRVQRFREGFTHLPPMGRLIDIARETVAYMDAFGEQAAQQLAQDMGWLMASELVEFDIDHSFAPILDLDRDTSKVIGDRAFSDDPQRTIDLAGAFINGMADAGMAATAKHFPGHGGVVADSHLELPFDSRPYEDILQRDLKPFIALQNEYAAVMTAHIAFTQCDELPVSFSSFWLKQILREKLGFSGLVVSDDLSMKGAAECGSYQERSELALSAGCDVILLCNQREEAEHVLEFLEAKALGEQGLLGVLSRRSSREEIHADAVTGGANKEKMKRIDQALNQFAAM